MGYSLFILRKPRKRLKLNQSANSFHENQEKIIRDVVSTSFQEGHAVFLTNEPLPHLLFLNKCFKYNFIIYVEQSKLT